MTKMTDNRLIQLKDQIALAERLASDDPRGTFGAILELMKMELAQYGGAIVPDRLGVSFDPVRSRRATHSSPSTSFIE